MQETLKYLHASLEKVPVCLSIKKGEGDKKWNEMSSTVCFTEYCRYTDEDNYETSL